MSQSQAENLLTITATAPDQDSVLTPDALSFLTAMVDEFSATRSQLLAARTQRQAALDAGEQLDFLTETAHVRDSDWKVAPIPQEASNRRTEITGPVSRKMVINALNSGAQVFMADFEDASSPTWANMIDGQINLRDAVNGSIDFTAPNGKHYALSDKPALLMVRPRGWHLPEKHVLRNGEPISGSLFDFALFLFHNHKALAAKDSRPYFYLPKLEHYLEARLWNDVISWAEAELGIPHGTVKATVLIETLPAAFQMDEILYELRDRIQGLNCGRWDYIFSYIKSFRTSAQHVLPDRGQVTMAVGFLNAYSLLLIKTCHRRGAMAMGGMAAQIPVKGDEQANRIALDKVRADKQREASNGHDGTWVAHPALEPIARAEFDQTMPSANQMHVLREDVSISAADLLKPVQGSISRQGMEDNIRIAVLYISAWLAGNGCVPIDNLMEDAATAEISRTQLWHWIQHDSARLDSGEAIDAALYQSMSDRILETLLGQFDDNFQPYLRQAAELLDKLVLSDDLATFLTLDAYQQLQG